MKFNKTNKYFILLLILIFCMQLIPLESSDIEAINSNIKNEITYITSITNNNTAIITKRNEKPSFKYQVLTYKIIFYDQIFFQFKSTDYIVKSSQVNNSRKKIQSLMTSYFNGSKYKGETFLI